MHKILMVCMANICRSPMAVGAMQTVVLARRVEHLFQIDSAGTHVRRHAGQRPDPRAIESMARFGYMGTLNQRSRPIMPGDFGRFDLIIAMDEDNLRSLKKICPPELQQKLYRLLDFADTVHESDIPDPYFGNAAGFDRVLSLCEAGVTGLVNRCLRTPLEPQR
ncbi:MAG: low molecular weight protein-tyrosine-phosphatase [Burkholderiaceae bacterium]